MLQPRSGNSIRIGAATLKSLPALPSVSAATAAGTLGLRAGFVDAQRPAVQVRAVQRRDRLLAFAIVRHLDKSETSGLPSVAVRANVHASNRPVRFEKRTNGVFGSPKAEVPNINIFHRYFILYRFEGRLIWRADESSGSRDARKV